MGDDHEVLRHAYIGEDSLQEPVVFIPGLEAQLRPAGLATSVFAH